jgi:hypothetical protein
MYHATLLLHSWIRWIVVVLGIVAIARASAGADRRDRAALLFTIAVDVQFLVGILLYVALSPMTRAAIHNMGGAMHTSALRFWAVEHPFGMVLALVFAHVGRSRPRRAALFFTTALVLILLGMPWPGLPYGRPLFRV